MCFSEQEMGQLKGQMGVSGPVSGFCCCCFVVCFCF